MASSARNSIASGRNPVKVSVLVGMALASFADRGAAYRATRRAGDHPSMTDLATDTRVIDVEAPQYNATLVRRDDLTESLASFWVRFDGQPTPCEAGQYMTIGVMVEGRSVQRPDSGASPPALAGSEGYEFYVRLVNGGT